VTQESLVRLGDRGTVVTATADDVQVLQQEFATHHFVRFRGLLGGPLLERILRDINRSTFTARVHEGVGTEQALSETSRPTAALVFLASDAGMCRLVSDITACGPIGCFAGRVFRMSSTSGHYDEWHTDAAHHRLVGMSVNLTTVPYEGGSLELRKVGDCHKLVSVSNPGLGDAVLFRIDPRFEHQIAAVEGVNPRTAFAGWFCSQPVFMDMLRGGDRSSTRAAGATMLD
jgi:hypothetical protein